MMNAQSKKAVLSPYTIELTYQELSELLPSSQPTGTYCVGLGRHPVLVQPTTHLVIATQSTGQADTLFHLTKTVAATAMHWYATGNLVIQVITSRTNVWQKWFHPITPQDFLRSIFPQFRQIFCKKASRRFLLILDEYRSDWELTAEMISKLISVPNINLFIATRPKNASDLVQHFPTVPIIVGNLPKKFGDHLMLSIPNVKLGYGEYALRDQVDQWQFFTTVTQRIKK